MDDVKEFPGLLEAFNTMAFEREEEDEILRIAAGVSHMGNLQFVEDGDEADSRAAAIQASLPWAREQAAQCAEIQEKAMGSSSPSLVCATPSERESTRQEAACMHEGSMQDVAAASHASLP